jgi:NET1-associated nuclear protein 1 (U3 small nucleolar RNA-associated protein 17)
MHASWSPDGSLLAVAFGAFVNLYDPLSSDLLQSLAAPFCKTVTKAHFIGQTGHYIAATGYKEVILWDVVSGSGAFWRNLLSYSPSYHSI